MDGACGMYGRGERFIQGLRGNVREKRPRGRTRHRWEDNIKMALQKVGWGAWTQLLAQGRDKCLALVNAVMNYRVP
jgi:hypothetical protein